MTVLEPRLTVLQSEEIRMGKEADLSEDAIALYADPKLNYLQMKVLREALCEGAGPEELRPIAKPWIPAWQMEELIKDKDGETAFPIPGRPFPLKPILLTAAAVLVLLPLFLLGRPAEEPVLELTGDEVRIACGTAFKPEAYIRTYTGAQEELVLPDSFTAKRPETRLVQYRMEHDDTVIRKNLRVQIVDETPPELKLKTEKTELLKETPFSCQSYVFSVTDNVDPDLSAEVQCSDVLQDTETQTVEYTVADRSGNKATAILQVHFADYAETHETVSPTASPSAAPRRQETLAASAPVPVQQETPVPVIEPILS